MTSLRHHTAGQRTAWQFTSRPQDATLRRHIHGKVQPMERPSWFARLLGRRA